MLGNYSVIGLLFAILTAFVQRFDVWESVYNYGRIFTPLILLVVVGWLPLRPRLAVLPIAFLMPRLVMQYGKQLLGVANAVLGS